MAVSGSTGGIEAAFTSQPGLAIGWVGHPMVSKAHGLRTPKVRGPLLPLLGLSYRRGVANSCHGQDS